MGGISSTLQLNDMMTRPLMGITNALNLTISAFESMQLACGESFDNSTFEAATSTINDVNAEMEYLNESVRAAGSEQQNFNNHMQNGVGIAANLGNQIKRFVGAFVGIAAAKKAVSWISDSLDLTNVQTNAERQMDVVLKNVGAADDAFQRLKDSAASIQGYTLYGDETLIGGAAELATYISDDGAIESMMGTLANYAAGMSGGGEVGYQQMVEYATQLGKALDGSYDGLRKKGFILSETQKEIIENGSDMEKALIIDDVINQSWANLAAQMANTPQGKIIQMKNAFGDIREEVGAKLYPAVLSLFTKITDNMPRIENGLYAFADGVQLIIYGIEQAIDFAGWFADTVSENWSLIGPVIMGVVAAILAYNTVATVTNIIMGLQTAAATAKAAADMLQSGATFTATVAQHGLNAALLACPITWIVIAIIALVAALYVGVGALNKFAGTSLSATGLIAGAFAGLAAAIYNKFIVLTWNAVAAFVNFFANVFDDPVSAVKILFLDMATTVIGYIQTMASAIEKIINKIPGVTVDITSGLDAFQNMLKATSEKVKSEAEWVEVMETKQYLDVSKVMDAGYDKGKVFEDKIKDFDPSDLFKDFMPGNDNVYEGVMGGMADDLSDIAGNTGAMKNSVEISEENLKYLRDLAETDKFNRITIENTINFENTNTIQNADNIDGLVERITEQIVEGVSESMDMAMEGVFA